MTQPAGDAQAQRAALTRGILLTFVAMNMLPGTDAIAKHLAADGFAVVQIIWARFSFTALIVVPVALLLYGRRREIAGGSGSGARGGAVWPHVVRGALHAASTFLLYVALKTMPLADGLAVFYAFPFVVTALAPFLLGEATGIRRWSAVGIGFLGTCLIVKPGLGVFEPAALFALAGCVAFALYLILTRRTAGRTPPIRALAWQSIAAGLLLSLIVPFFWTPPGPRELAFFLALGVISAIGHLMLIIAFSSAPASVLVPIGYTELGAAVLIGYLAFGDIPDGLTWSGMAVIAAGGIYISWREHVASKRAAHDQSRAAIGEP